MPKPVIRPLGAQEDVSMEGTLSPQSLSQMRSEVRRKRANRDWLDSHRDELRAKYADKYVAVVDGAVIGDSDKFPSLIASLRKRLAPEDLLAAAIEFISKGELVWIL